MRKTYLLLLTLLVSIVAMAGPITPDEARQRINKYMSPRRAGAAAESLRLVATKYYQEREGVTAPSLYVFNVGEGQGYVIAGADDRIPAVLGYSDQGALDPDDMPVNMQAWLEGYNDQMEYLDRHPEAAAPRRTVSGTSIDPLLISKWGQGNPYNSMCPMDDGKHSAVGCSATAMAQIMYYWKWPYQTNAEIPEYVTEAKQITVAAIPAGTVIDWDNMLPRYTGNETEAQMNAVATLSLLCGASIVMDYSSKSSGAWVTEDAWETIFDYDAALVYEQRGNYRLAAWNQKVYDELAAQRPVLYTGFSSGSGHTFVIDGYGDDDYFHVNWGWYGGSNGYFLLSILDPNNNTGIGASSSSDGYSFSQSAFFGVQPNTGVIPPVTPVLSSYYVRLPSGNEFTRSSAESDFSFQVAFNYFNFMNETYSFDFSVGLFDTNDNLLGVVSKILSITDLPPNYGWKEYPMQVEFGSGLANGTYWLKAISRQKGTKTWYPNKYTDTYFLSAKISDNTITLSEPTFGLTGSMEFSGKKEVGSNMSLTVTITNDGTFFNDQVYLLVNGNTEDDVVGGRYLDIDAGGTETLDFTLTPEKTGENVMTLCTRTWNGDEHKYEYHPFVTGSVTIEEAAEATLTMTPKTKNAVKEDSENVVKEDKAIISIAVRNTGDTDYDNDLIVRLYKYINANNGTFDRIGRKAIQLAAGESTNVEIEFDDLEDGAKYFYYVYYLSNGKEVLGNSHSPIFTVQIGGDTPASVRPLWNGENGPAQIFSLDGRKQGNAPETDLMRVLDSLPKGVYIIRVGGNSKIVRN